MWNPFRKKVVTARSVEVHPDKRAVLKGRIEVALAKLEKRVDEAATRKAAELRRSLRVMELEAEMEAVRSGVVVEVPAGSLNVRGG